MPDTRLRPPPPKPSKVIQLRIPITSSHWVNAAETDHTTYSITHRPFLGQNWWLWVQARFQATALFRQRLISIPQSNVSFSCNRQIVERERLDPNWESVKSIDSSIWPIGNGNLLGSNIDRRERVFSALGMLSDMNATSLLTLRRVEGDRNHSRRRVIQNLVRCSGSYGI